MRISRIGMSSTGFIRSARGVSCGGRREARQSFWRRTIAKTQDIDEEAVHLLNSLSSARVTNARRADRATPIGSTIAKTASATNVLIVART